jgi:hypothetical protein
MSVAGTWIHECRAQIPIAAPTPLADSLIQLEQRSWQAWKARDGAFFRTFLSEDHVEIGFGGRASKNEVVETVGTPRCIVRSYTLTEFRFSRIDSETALLTYHAAQDTRCGGNAVPSPVWVTSIYARRDNRWLNVVYQQTQDTRKQN